MRKMDNKQKKSLLAKCPECDTALKLPDDASIGKILECSACGTENEIVGQNPVTLAPLEEEK